MLTKSSRKVAEKFNCEKTETNEFEKVLNTTPYKINCQFRLTWEIPSEFRRS